jgi:hypothetical protein
MAILADILQKTQMIATSTAVLPSQTAISVDGPLGKTTLFTSTVIKSFLMAILAAHHSTMKVIWMLTKTIMLMTAAANQVEVVILTEIILQIHLVKITPAA